MRVRPLSRLKHRLKRLRNRRARRRAVHDLSRSLTLIVDRQALSGSVGARIKELFDPDRIYFLLPDRQREQLRLSSSAGTPLPDRPVAVAQEGKMVRWLLVNQCCLLLDRQREVLGYLEEAERALLDRLAVTVCVPMLSLNRLNGIIMLGADDPGWQLTSVDAQLLEQLASQASIAFENAALYGEQAERLESLHRAERLASVGQLAAAVAHEVRNPLTGIRSTMQYLLSGYAADDPKKELAEEILSGVDRINDTVSGLLSLSRPSEVRMARVPIRGVLEQAIRLLTAHAAKQRVELVLEASDGELVWGDGGQLKQVFLNLILNALEAMDDGGEIVARVGADPRQEGGRWVTVEIADDGPGIPEERQRRVFDPFFTSKREGTGLGLAICHGIIERHHGEIALTSSEGEGTTVTVRLPELDAQRPGAFEAPAV